MIAPRYSLLAEKKDPHNLEGTVQYYGEHMNNGLRDKLNRIARRKGIPEVDIDDVKQHVSLTLLQRAQSHPDQFIESPDRYIIKSFANACAYHQRNEVPRKDRTLYGTTPSQSTKKREYREEDPTVNLENKEKLVTVLAAIKHLDAKLQEVIRIHYRFNFTYSETSDILQMPVGTVKSRINKGIKAIHSLLGLD